MCAHMVLLKERRVFHCQGFDREAYNINLSLYMSRGVHGWFSQSIF